MLTSTIRDEAHDSLRVGIVQWRSSQQVFGYTSESIAGVHLLQRLDHSFHPWSAT